MTAALEPRARDRGILHEEPLGPYLWWGVGGPAERLFTPRDSADLGAFLAALAPEEPLFWLGLGSNVLVREGGLRGVVVRTAGVLDEWRREASVVAVGAGLPCPKFARLAAAQGLGGGEFLAGVPGTLGGALAMNAGAHGGETWALVRRVRTVDRRGVERWRPRADFRIGYREVRGPAGEWFVGAELELCPAPVAACRARVRELLRLRAATQPIGQRSCGSVFRNPPGDHAARLIEGCGLKGARCGGALVSPKHANFIVVDGSVRARDVEELMERVARTVAEQTGVCLEPEIRVIGDPAGGGR